MPQASNASAKSVKRSRNWQPSIIPKTEFAPENTGFLPRQGATRRGGRPYKEGNGNSGAFAPEEVGGKANKKQKDGGGEVHELGRIAEGEIDGITDDGGSGENEEHRRPGITGNAIGNWPARRSAAKGENGGGTKAVEDPADKDHPTDQRAETAQLTGTHQNCRPYAESDDSRCRRQEPRMNFGEFLEKEFVVGHGVENARSCKDHAIGGAESGNQNGERH